MENNFEQIEEYMENINTPKIKATHYQNEFRLTLLNTKKSAIAGVALLILPFLFISGVIFKHYLQIDLGLFTSIYNWIGLMDEKYGDSSILNWIIRALLILGPLTAIGLNLVSVVHVRYEKTTKEILLALKLKWVNWTIIALCSSIFLVFFLYLILENFNH